MRNLFGLLVGAIVAIPSYATVVYSVNTGVVNAEADFTFGTGTLTITLKNLQANPTTDAQNINGISFTLPETFGTNIVADTSFTSADRSNIQKNVAAGWTDASDTTNHWFLTNTAHTFAFTTIGNPQAPYTIIGGPNTSNNEYTNANASITNHVHDPFLNQTATWVLSIPGVTAADEGNLSNVVFAFSTAAGNTQSGTLVSTTPEPVSFLLAGCGLGLLGWLRLSKNADR